MLKEYTKFYYSALPSNKKEIYRKIYDALSIRCKTIEILVDTSVLTRDELIEIVMAIYNDTPSFYYVQITSISYTVTRSGYIITPNYLYSGEQIKKLDAQLEQGLQRFKSKYITPSMNEYEREKVIHDFLVKTITYDYEALSVMGGRVDEIYNVLGALLKKKAVCWGIACAFKLLCDYCQIKSLVVIGNTIPIQGDAGHAWNMVKLDGETYHVDVTWDIKEKGDISFCYDYLNLSDSLMRMNHTWESTLYPKCNAIKYNYYYRNHLYVKTVDELVEYVAKKLCRAEHYIAVKFANSMPTKKEIEDGIRKGFQKASRCASYSYLISEETHNIYVEII